MENYRAVVPQEGSKASLRAIGFIGQQCLLLGLVAGLALGLGWVSRFLFVVLLPGIVIGLLAGAVIGFFGLISQGWTPIVKRVSLGLGILVGFLVLQVVDDFHHVTSFRQQIALAVYADSGADGEVLGDEEMEFFARGADEVLAKSMKESVGSTGPVARWLHRADGGIRTFGSWERRRVIPVGRTFTILFLLFDLSVSYWFGLRVLERIKLNSEESDREGDVLDGDVPDLQDEGEEDQGSAR